jgi:hypothetical protein
MLTQAISDLTPVVLDVPADLLDVVPARHEATLVLGELLELRLTFCR